jgi:hypothetical protein
LFCCCDKNILTKSNCREERIYLAYFSRSQSNIEGKSRQALRESQGRHSGKVKAGTQGRNLKTGLLIDPHSITSNIDSLSQVSEAETMEEHRI